MTHQPQQALAPRRTRGLALVGASILAFGVAACGAGRSSPSTTTTNSVAATTSTTTPAPPPPAPHLRIVSPRHGAHAKQTLTVRVSLSGAKAAGNRAFRYILGGRLIRLGADQLTYHELAAGHQHLVVALASRRSVKASVSFTVMAPPPPPTPAPAPSAPAPTTAPATSPSTMQPPATMSSIPQGPTAGDADGDNHGGPSDGDGNV